MGCVHGKYCCDYRSENESGDDGVEGRVRVQRIHDQETIQMSQEVLIPSHDLKLEYAFHTRRGFYPNSPERQNQDCLCIKTHLRANPNRHFFGVFDGHGQFGGQCSNFVKDRLVEILSSSDSKLSEEEEEEDPIKHYRSAFLATNVELHESEIDDSLSGTTAITVLVAGDTLYVANVGDSRAVLAVCRGESIVAEDLSCDQTPFRRDEYERVKLAGARVLSVDQVEGVKDPSIQDWGDEEDDDEGDPPRLWVADGMYPGTAFTRSVGDSTAETIGVTAEPEVFTVKITPEHLFLVIASDGVFEFLSSQAVVDMVAEYNDPRDACSAVAAESYKLWLDNETRTDDITIIVVHIKDTGNSGAVETTRSIDIINIAEGDGDGDGDDDAKATTSTERGGGPPETNVFPKSNSGFPSL